MTFEERPRVSRASRRTRAALWRPEIATATARGERTVPLDLSRDDRYVVVDDIGEGIVVLQASRWPHLDGAGRLAFTGEPASFWTPLDAAQALVNRHRERARQAAPDRPLRVGDAFAIRGLGDREPSLDAVTRIIDVSAAARDAAKAALFGAAAATVRETYERQMALDAEPTEADESAGYFDVRLDTSRDAGGAAGGGTP